MDNWTSTSCNCASGFQGTVCGDQITASFTSSMGMKFDSQTDVFNVTFDFMASSSWDGIILSTDNQVSC